MNLYLKLFSLAILLISAFCGCSMKTMAIRSTAEIMDDGMAAFYDEEDVVFAREAASSNLKLIEGLIRGDPGNEKLLLTAAQGFGGYAFGFMEMDMERYYDVDDDKYEETKARAKIFYRRGLKYALKIIAPRYPKFKELMEKGAVDEMQQMAAKIDKKYIGALFWTAFCWGSIINLSRDDMTAISALPKVKAVMARVMEIDETYFNAGPHLFFAVLNAGMPQALGGNPEEAKKHFEIAFKINDNKLMLANVFYARFYAVAVQDRELYEKQLDKVLEAPNDIFPGQTLYTMLAKERAKILKGRTDDYISD